MSNKSLMSLIITKNQNPRVQEQIHLQQNKQSNKCKQGFDKFDKLFTLMENKTKIGKLFKAKAVLLIPMQHLKGKELFNSD